MDNNIEKLCKEGNLEEAVKEVRVLFTALAPNDLNIYLKLSSIEHDLNGDKDTELIKASILSINTSLLSSWNSKGERYKNLTLALLSYSLIPAMPILANSFKNITIDDYNIMLSVALYCVSVSLSLKESNLRLIGMVLSIFTFLLIGGKEAETPAFAASLIIAFMIFSLHCYDRVKRHLINHEQFLA